MTWEGRKVALEEEEEEELLDSAWGSTEGELIWREGVEWDGSKNEGGFLCDRLRRSTKRMQTEESR
jgi:hypothetical protein